MTTGYEDLIPTKSTQASGYDDLIPKQASSSGVPGPRRAWSDVPGEALRNVPASAGRFLGGMVEAVTSPVQTAKGLLDIGAGALQNVMPQGVRDFINQFDANPEAAKRAVNVANAVGGMYAQRYGTEEGLKEALATDPVGVASDLSTLLSGGATLTAKAAPAVSRAMTTAARITNPLTPVVGAANYLGSQPTQPAVNALTKAKGAVGDTSAGVAGSIVGGISGKPGLAYKEAYKAGKAGDVTFLENLRGKTAPDEVLLTVREGIDRLRSDAATAYQTAKTGWAADKTPLDFAPIDAAYQKVKNSLSVGGKSKIGPDQMHVVDEIGTVLDEWRNDPAARTALDLDALKQRIDAIYPDSSKHTQAQRAVTDVRNAVKDAIVAQAPDYKQAMKAYETQQALMQDITKALGASDKATKETAINKIIGSIKSTPAGEFRRQLVDILKQQTGTDIMPAIAGQELAQWMPTSGVGRTVAAGGLTTAYALRHPELAAVLPFTSPRLMGEAFYKAGQASGKGKQAMAAVGRLTPEQVAYANALFNQARNLPQEQQNQNALKR